MGKITFEDGTPVPEEVLEHVQHETILYGDAYIVRAPKFVNYYLQKENSDIIEQVKEHIKKIKEKDIHTTDLKSIHECEKLTKVTGDFVIPVTMESAKAQISKILEGLSVEDRYWLLKDLADTAREKYYEDMPEAKVHIRTLEEVEQDAYDDLEKYMDNLK